ncbi:hypothetical protein [Deinococcus aetherius]|uniref:hypothetical protein n=1 Tax=Deinococcus aetherius TaxID=200252 RepID=UPI002230A391|nr:hypothetical protein [Deinococcus aetherius]
MTREDKKRRIFELRHLLLTSDGQDDEKLLVELNSIVVHPAPTDILFNLENYSEDEFFALLLDYQPIVLPR